MQTILVKAAPETNNLPRPAIPASHGLGARVNPFSSSSNLTATDSPAKRRCQGDQGLIEALVQSKVYQEYERAFTEATGMPMALRPVETWQLPLHGKRHESPYCALMSEKSRACASCLQMQERLSQAACLEPSTMVCPSGLCESAVPVRLGERVVGFLMTGQVFRTKPTEAQFERLARHIKESGVDVDAGT